MSSIKSRNRRLLANLDVDHTPFECCGNEDLIFLRCVHCEHVWVECYECSTWFVDLNDLSKQQSSFLSDVNARLSCPACSASFADFFYLKEGVVDRYLATAEQVAEAGFGRFLAPHLRDDAAST